MKEDSKAATKGATKAKTRKPTSKGKPPKTKVKLKHVVTSLEVIHQWLGVTLVALGRYDQEQEVSLGTLPPILTVHPVGNQCNVPGVDGE